MQEINIIDPAKAREELATYIQNTERQLAVVKLVIEALKDHEGKPVTKRIATALAKKFPEYQFSLTSPYSWFDLNISGEEFPTINLKMCYTSEPVIVSNKRIVELNQCYLLDDVRLPQYRATLKDVEKRVIRFNEALVELYRARNTLGEGKFSFDHGGSLPVLKDMNDKYISDSNLKNEIKTK